MLPQAQGNAFEVSWKPKQAKIPSTPVTPRDQRTGSPLPPPQPGGGNGQRSPQEGNQLQRSPRDGNQVQPSGKKEGAPKGLHKPQPLQPQVSLIGLSHGLSVRLKYHAITILKTQVS